MNTKELDTYSDEDLRRLEFELQANLLEKSQAEAFWDYAPYPFQEPWWANTKPITGLLCGNQTGKTTFGVMKMLAACTGVMPEFMGGMREVGFPEGVCRGKRYLAAGHDFDVVRKETIVPKLDEFITEEMLDGAPSMPATGGLLYRFKSGAELKIKSYKQHRKSFEGSVYNGAWFDEPPSEDIWTAVMRGLVAKDGWIILSATSLDEAWTYDQILEPAEDPNHPRHSMVAKFEAVMHDNCRDCHGGALPHDRIVDLRNSISDDDEKAARLDGQIRKMEKVNFRYISEKIHAVPDFELPDHWPIVEVVDPSITRGLWMGWFTTDPEDPEHLWFWFKAAQIKDSGFFKLAEGIKRHRSEFAHPPEIAIMDQRGGRATIDKKEDTTWFDELSDQGLDYVPSVDRPFSSMHDWLEEKWRPLREKTVPKLRFFQSVVELEKGPWWALKRFMWDPENMSRHQLYNQKSKDFVDVTKYFMTYPDLDETVSQSTSPGGSPWSRSVSLAQTYSPKRKEASMGMLTLGGRGNRSSRRRRGSYY